MTPNQLMYYVPYHTNSSPFRFKPLGREFFMILQHSIIVHRISKNWGHFTKSFYNPYSDLVLSRHRILYVHNYFNDLPKVISETVANSFWNKHFIQNHCCFNDICIVTNEKLVQKCQIYLLVLDLTWYPFDCQHTLSQRGCRNLVKINSKFLAISTILIAYRSPEDLASVFFLCFIGYIKYSFISSNKQLQFPIFPL